MAFIWYYMKTKPYVSKGMRRILRNRKIGGFVFIISILILFYLTTSLYQGYRYDKNGYNCVGMSKDCEAFFEAIGLNTQIIKGLRCCEGELQAHCWLLIDIPFIGKHEFEATTLFFEKTSDFYKVYSIDDGWI
jgi:hypothetical protein